MPGVRREHERENQTRQQKGRGDQQVHGQKTDELKQRLRRNRVVVKGNRIESRSYDKQRPRHGNRQPPQAGWNRSSVRQRPQGRIYPGESEGEKGTRNNHVADVRIQNHVEHARKEKLDHQRVECGQSDPECESVHDAAECTTPLRSAANRTGPGRGRRQPRSGRRPRLRCPPAPGLFLPPRLTRPARRRWHGLHTPARSGTGAVRRVASDPRRGVQSRVCCVGFRLAFWSCWQPSRCRWSAVPPLPSR